jgi:hypothetical protein
MLLRTRQGKNPGHSPNLISTITTIFSYKHMKNLYKYSKLLTLCGLSNKVNKSEQVKQQMRFND